MIPWDPNPSNIMLNKQLQVSHFQDHPFFSSDYVWIRVVFGGCKFLHGFVGNPSTRVEGKIGPFISVRLPEKNSREVSAQQLKQLDFVCFHFLRGPTTVSVMDIVAKMLKFSGKKNPKIHMSPKNGPFQKEHFSSNCHFSGAFPVSFRGTNNQQDHPP